jgi:hypothetical protein
MSAVAVQARPEPVEAFRFDGSEEGAKALRDWAKEKGAEASFFWARKAWNDQDPDPAVRVQHMVVVNGMWVVAGPVWQVLLAEKFAAMFTVVGA